MPLAAGPLTPPAPPPRPDLAVMTTYWRPFRFVGHRHARRVPVNVPSTAPCRCPRRTRGTCRRRRRGTQGRLGDDHAVARAEPAGVRRTAGGNRRRVVAVRHLPFDLAGVEVVRRQRRVRRLRRRTPARRSRSCSASAAPRRPPGIRHVAGVAADARIERARVRARAAAAEARRRSPRPARAETPAAARRGHDRPPRRTRRCRKRDHRRQTRCPVMSETGRIRPRPPVTIARIASSAMRSVDTDERRHAGDPTLRSAPWHAWQCC